VVLGLHMLWVQTRGQSELQRHNIARIIYLGTSYASDFDLMLLLGLGRDIKKREELEICTRLSTRLLQ